MNKIDEIFSKFQKLPVGKKTIVYSLTIAIILSFYLLLACLVGEFIKSLKVFTNEELKSAIWYGLIDKNGRTISLVVCAVFTVLILIVYFRINHRNHVSKEDERGVEFMEKGTHGTSEWLSREEAEQIYKIGNIKDIKDTVYGQYTNKGEQVVAYKPTEHGGSGDMNNLIIGSPGTGKSHGFVRTELIQTMERHESFICTDPSTELYTSLSEYCRNMGANVKALNLANPTYSDCWNCLNETINPETERLDGTRLNDFVNIYMKNSSDDEGKSEEKFWYDCAKNLLTAVVGLCSYRREFEIVKQYKELYAKIAGVEAKEDTICFKMNKASFKWSRARILEAARIYGADINEINEIFKNIVKGAPNYNIGLVYDTLMNFKKVEEEFQWIPDWHPAKTAYKIYQTNASSDTVKSSALQGAQMRMQIFSDEKIRYILSHDGIDLAKCNEEQSAYFIITSDKSTATKPIASLVFSFLFKDAQDEFDKAEQLSQEKGIPNPRLPITVMLDEFFSVGIIGGNPDAFAITMSNSRKRKLHISIIVQAYPQIRALYGEDDALTILNCCGTIIFLGCNDPETAKFISEFVSGEATVLNEEHEEASGLFSNVGNSVGMQSAARQLLTIDEARRWEHKILVARRGKHPLKLEPFGWIYHPAYLSGKTPKKSVFTSIKNLDDLIENSESESNTAFLAKVNEMIKNIKTTKEVDKKTGEIVDKKTETETIENKKRNKKNKNKDNRSINKKEEQLNLNIFQENSKTPQADNQSAINV